MNSAAAAREQSDVAPIAAPARAGETLVLNDHLRSTFDSDDAFDRIMQLDGEVFRQHKHRRTIRVTIGGRAYFVKIHEHSGYGEILKNLLYLRLPILTARPEYEAIRRITEMGVPTMTVAGFGVRGSNPARLRSFIITDELEHTESLEHLVPRWNDLPPQQRAHLRNAAAGQIGAIARKLLDNGLNHRDFYLCHFLTRNRQWSEWKPPDGLTLHLIDLHRVQMRRRTPRRWMVKDLAGLLYSSLDEHPTPREMLRFWRAYRGGALKESFAADRGLIERIMRRAMRQYEARHGTPPPRVGPTPSSA